MRINSGDKTGNLSKEEDGRKKKKKKKKHGHGEIIHLDEDDER